jgi:hypothetical protein
LFAERMAMQGSWGTIGPRESVWSRKIVWMESV